MLNDARVASLGFFKINVFTTRIHKEKNFKIKFQVLLKFAQILPDYSVRPDLVPNCLQKLSADDTTVGGRVKHVFAATCT